MVANQPLHLSGALTVDASDKFARFVRFCDAFNIPVVLLVDVPGYFPGIDQEHRGIINHGAKVLYALCEATVPKVSVILRKCYGGGMLAMGGHKAIRIDQAFGWPASEQAPIGAEAAVALLYRDQLRSAADPADAPPGVAAGVPRRARQSGPRRQQALPGRRDRAGRHAHPRHPSS